jgi:hypothetical protein
MSIVKSYERALSSLAAEARLGRDDRAVSEPDEQAAASKRASGRVWVNGEEVGGSDPKFAHLQRIHD